MIGSIVLLIIGLVVLTWGADFLVRGASKLALAVNVSPLVIGLTIVAFGTSAPELTVSSYSAWRGLMRQGRRRREMTITHKTTARQLGSVLFLLRVATMTLPLPSVLGMPSSQGLWLAGIVGTVISLPLLAWMVTLSRAEGLDDVVRISRRLLGPIGGSTVGWLFVLYWLILAAFELRYISEAYLTGTMP